VRIAAGLALLVLAGCMQGAAPVAQGPLSGTVLYTCDGGRTLPVDYAPEADPPEITINVDGRETLLLEPDTGAVQRYSWPSDGSFHIWELAGGVGTLRYRDGEAGTTSTVLSNCRG
jgi:hypothetical protein